MNHMKLIALNNLKKHWCAWFLYASAIIIVCLFSMSSTMAYSSKESNQKADKKHVLVLNAYNKGYKWTDNEVQGIEDAFANEPHVILHIEYMDTKVINDEQHFLLLKNLFKNKYKTFKFDAIISTDDDALKFLRKYRDELFGKVPVIFCGVNNFNAAKVADFDHYTGVNEEADFVANMELILKNHPDLKKLYVINDRLTTGKSLQKAFEKTIKKYHNKFHEVYLGNLSMAQIKQKVATLGNDSVVFYLSFFKDKNGVIYTPIEVIPQISAAASVPVYGSVDYMLGYGIVGGMLKNSYYQGETGAELTKRVLNGKNVNDIPVVIESPNQYMFDYKQMKRFGLSPSQLPNGSIIINEPETFFYKYKKAIFTVLAIFIILLIYIFTLLLNIRKRVRAQKGLQAILESSTALIDVHSVDGFKNGIVKSINKIIPINTNVAFFNVPELSEIEEGKELNAIEGCGTYEYDKKKGLKKDLSTSIRGLVNQALKSKRSLTDKKHSVAIFNNKSLPVNMIYAEGDRKFDDIDNNLLEMFTSNLSMALDNLEKHKIEESLETARKIQMSMLPRGFEQFCQQYPIDIYAYLSPAKEVGGDLYDFFVKNTDQMFITVGDVSDKGVPAALFMAVAKTLIRSGAERTIDPAEILFKVNNELCQNNEESMFVTLVLGVLNLTTGKLRYANAGHTPCYLLSEDGSIEQVQAITAMPLGVFEDVEYTTEELILKDKQSIMLYSDGVTEAMNSDFDLFEEARLEASLIRSAGGNAHSIAENIIEDVKLFAGNAQQSDDITLLAVKNVAKNNSH